MKNISILFVTVLLLTTHSVAQWTRISAIPADDVVSLAAFGDTILAASGSNLIFKSVDDGVSWDTIVISSNPIVIVSLKIIDNKIYVGTSTNGVFCSEDFGVTWPNTGAGLFAVSGFEKKGSDVYAATLGGGVYVFNQTINNWIPFNNSLPTYSVNVFTILRTDSSLLIGPGANGTFYRYNFVVNGWNEEYYDGILHPGVKIDKLLLDSNTIFAVSGNRIIRSEDDGLSWINDTIGTHDGGYRFMSSGENKNYTITNILTGGTWIQERNRGSNTGTTWATNEDFFSTGFSYEILEFHNKLFLAKGDGLYTKSAVQGIDDPLNDESIVKIYPNPSDASVFNISSANRINKFSIINSLGEIIFSENIDKSEFRIQPHLSKGFYFINLTLSNGQSITKKIIVE